jgi:mannose-6-phosphate isomerase-like protein (cupin superfamily)
MTRHKIVKLEGKEAYQRLLEGHPETSGMRSGLVTLEPGGSVGEHSTGSKEEAIIILQGKGELSCNGEVLATAGENTLIYVPPETTHDVKNTGEEVLKYVYVVSPVKRSA